MTDIQYFEDLYADFEQLIDSADQTAHEPRLGAANSSSPGRLFGGRRLRRLLRPSRPVFTVRHAWLAAAASLVALSAVVASESMVTSSPTNSATPPAKPQSRATPQSGVTPGTGSSALQEQPIRLGVNPFGPSGSVTSLSQLQATLHYPVVVPDTPLASNASLGTIWVDSQTQNAALYYPASGVEVFLHSSPNVFDFTGLPVQTVNGTTAAVLDQDLASTPPEPGRVYLVLNGHSVEVDGFRASGDLVAVANSLGPPS